MNLEHFEMYSFIPLFVHLVFLSTLHIYIYRLTILTLSFTINRNLRPRINLKPKTESCNLVTDE